VWRSFLKRHKNIQFLAMVEEEEEVKAIFEPLDLSVNCFLHSTYIAACTVLPEGIEEPLDTVKQGISRCRKKEDPRPHASITFALVQAELAKVHVTRFIDFLSQEVCRRKLNLLDRLQHCLGQTTLAALEQAIEETYVREKTELLAKKNQRIETLREMSYAEGHRFSSTTDSCSASEHAWNYVGLHHNYSNLMNDYSGFLEVCDKREGSDLFYDVARGCLSNRGCPTYTGYQNQLALRREQREQWAKQQHNSRIKKMKIAEPTSEEAGAEETAAEILDSLRTLPPPPPPPEAGVEDPQSLAPQVPPATSFSPPRPGRPAKSTN
jgi:hypothetical protein